MILPSNPRSVGEKAADANNMWITMLNQLISRSTSGHYSTAAKLLTDIAKADSPG